MDSNTNATQTLYKPDDLRNLIRQLLNDQNLWIRFLIISKVSKLGDVEVVTNRLFENAIDFGNLFRIYYGDTIGKEIENILRTYFSSVIALIDAYVITTFGTPSNTDYTLINQVNDQLCATADQFSKLLHDINPNWDQQTFHNIFMNNIDMLNDEIYRRRTNQFYEDVTLYDNIEYYFLMTADILWNGFLKQFYR